MKIKIKNPIDKIYQLKRNNEAFTLISTTLTKNIITESNHYYYTDANGLKMSELNLIKTVKDYVINNKIEAVLNKYKPQYINKGKIKNATYKNELFEIDLKSAYWNFAYKNGFISTEIYLKGNNTKLIRKKARLIALGNLAKVQTVFEYNGSEFLKPTEIKSPTENIFFKVSQQTDDIMNNLKLIADENYLFYWVDAIFIQGLKAKNLIEEYLIDNLIDFKTIPIDKILKTRSYIKVTDSHHEQTRPFIFESPNIKDFSIIVD